LQGKDLWKLFWSLIDLALGPGMVFIPDLGQTDRYQDQGLPGSFENPAHIRTAQDSPSNSEKQGKSKKRGALTSFTQNKR